MQLSLDYFHQKLCDAFPGSVTYVKEQELVFSSIEVLAAYEPDNTKHILYVDISLDEPPTTSRETTVITSTSRLHLFPHSTVVEVCDDIDLIDVYRTLSRELHAWLEWTEKVNHAIVQHADLQEIVDITKSFVHNPMYIADSSFKVIASTVGEMGEVSAIWNYQQKYGYLPYQVMQTLIETGELKLLTDSPHAFKIKSQAFNLPFISKSIHRHNEHYGYFFIIKLYGELSDCELEVAEYLGQLLSSAMFYEKSYFEISGFYHEHFFVDIIERKLTDLALIANQLKPLHWKTDGDYMLFHIDTAEDNVAIQHHIMGILGDSLQAQCLVYKDCVLGIMNDCSGRLDSIQEQLSSLARNFNRRVVLSDQFIHFCDLGLYFEQTSFALSFLKEQAAPIGLTSYGDLFLRHVNSLIDDHIPECRLVELLRMHDLTHGTDYCNTLYSWLVCDKNTVKAAQRLFIHRNTLIYRLDKINEISLLTAESVNDQARLILSLHKYCANDA